MADTDNRTQYEKLLSMLCVKAATVSTKVFTNTRPLATDKMDDFIVVRLTSQDPYADTHDLGYVQFHIFVRDRQGGIENVPRMGEMVQGVKALLPFNNDLATCNSKPVQLQSKEDGMGFHVTVLQYHIVVKL